MLFLEMNVWVNISIWAVILVVSIIVEISTVQLVSIWFSASSVVSLILAACGVPILIQVIVFVVLSVILMLISRPLVKKLNKSKKEATVPAESLVGEIVTVTKDILVGEYGEIKDRYEFYSASAPGESNVLKRDEKVKIIGLDGNKVIVERIN